jgi:protein-tyrosine phosphatase
MFNKKLIVPVCRGNIARSPVAEIIIRRELEVRGLRDQYEVLSRGTQGVALDDKEPVKFHNITFYPDEYNDLRAWLDERKIDLTSHTSTPIDINIAKHANVMLAMDKRTRQALLALFPDYAQKIHMFSELMAEEKEIIDPDGVRGRQKQEQIFNEIESTINSGFSHLLALVDGRDETTKEMAECHLEEVSHRKHERR